MILRLDGVRITVKYSRNQKTTRQLQEEREERERLEFLAEMKKGESKEKAENIEEDSKPEKDISQEDLEGKILKITRKKQEIDGTETVETIEIKKPEVIEAYLKIKVSILSFKGSAGCSFGLLERFSGTRHTFRELVLLFGLTLRYFKYSKTDKEALRRYLAENSDEEKEKEAEKRKEKRRLQEYLR